MRNCWPGAANRLAQSHTANICSGTLTGISQIKEWFSLQMVASTFLSAEVLDEIFHVPIMKFLNFLSTNLRKGAWKYKHFQESILFPEA